MPIVRAHEGGVDNENQNMRKETKIYLKHIRNKCKKVMFNATSI